MELSSSSAAANTTMASKPFIPYPFNISSPQSIAKSDKTISARPNGVDSHQRTSHRYSTPIRSNYLKYTSSSTRECPQSRMPVEPDGLSIIDNMSHQKNGNHNDDMSEPRDRQHHQIFHSNSETCNLKIHVNTDSVDSMKAKNNECLISIKNPQSNMASSSIAQASLEKIPHQQPFVRVKHRPKKNPPVISRSETPKSSDKKGHGLWQSGRYDTRGSPMLTPFSWDTYLKLSPARVAPREAFRQPDSYPQNKFSLGMKLEAKDPRNSNNWCLASVVGIEGLHIRLRFDGADKMNDLYELVDSDNIRPVGSNPRELLLPPTGFVHSLASYSKFVEKVLKSQDSTIASPDCFPETPPKPQKNLFETGMKLEAVDRKNRDLICPATIGEINKDGITVKVVFDGWKGSFDYHCEYYSRDLFPVNWCRDVGRPIQPPNGWEALLNKESNSSFSSEMSSPIVKEVSLSSTLSMSNLSRQSYSLNESSASQKRGRPKKDQVKSKSDKNIVSSTTKRHCDQQVTTQKVDIELALERAVDNLDHLFEVPSLKNEPEKNRYQCQRTVSYLEWQKTKLQSQMPHDSSTSSQHDSSYNESVSMVSTVSYQQDTSESDQSHSNLQHAPKKPKTEKRIDVIRRKPKMLSNWTVEDVLELISTEESLVKYSNIFVEHEIDGKAFKLLTTDILLKHMGMKIGPVLKINDLLEQVKKELLE